MTGLHRLSKQEYAHNYDMLADELYRFALCVTGDTAQTGCAMASLFVEGFISYEDERFNLHMFKVLWRLLESCPSQRGELYRENIMASGFADESWSNAAGLFDALGAMEKSERALLLLMSTAAISAKDAACILEIDEGEAESASRELYKKVSCMAAA